jgi:DNA transposition AAA+ family ATPase
MIQSVKKMFVHTLITALVFVGFTQTVQAAIISTEQVVSVAAAQQNRAKIAATFERADVQAELQKMGITTEEAQARVAALTDAETASIAHRVDSIPAGGDGIVGALIFIFVLLLVTDILGLTKVFPFTKSIRH